MEDNDDAGIWQLAARLQLILLALAFRLANVRYTPIHGNPIGHDNVELVNVIKTLRLDQFSIFQKDWLSIFTCPRNWLQDKHEITQSK